MIARAREMMIGPEKMIVTGERVGEVTGVRCQESER
jgi:hypothetical protein